MHQDDWLGNGQGEFGAWTHTQTLSRSGCSDPSACNYDALAIHFVSIQQI